MRCPGPAFRSCTLKARRLADDHAERERADAAVKAWLLAQIGKKRSAPPEYRGHGDEAVRPRTPASAVGSIPAKR